MVLFKIQFNYDDKEIEASVHELETYPEQWHINVTDERLPIEFRTTYIITYNYGRKEYNWGFPDFDRDHSFSNSVAQALINYIRVYGWDSVTI